MQGLFYPDGTRIEARAGLPVGDVKLADHRMLRFKGPAPSPGHALYWETENGLRVLGSMDPTQHGTLLHVSLSYRDRNPSWEDIKMVRDIFYPKTIDVMMVLPKAEDYVNFHQFTFHLWQTPFAWDVG